MAVVVPIIEHSGGHDSNIVVVGGNGNHILKVVIMEIVPAHRIIPLLTAHDLVSMSPCSCCAANSGRNEVQRNVTWIRLAVWCQK